MAVTQALLELDCFPAGMELFPASDDDSWTVVKSVIDDSDYYVVILAGRYGSLGQSGIGFTEMEYDYAVQKKKPILAFVHQDPSSIESGKSESTEEGRGKLRAFREKVERKQCKYWDSADGLAGAVSRSLSRARKSFPRPGWVPGEFAANEEMLRELADLRKKVAELSNVPRVDLGLPPDGVEEFVGGESTIFWENGKFRRFDDTFFEGFNPFASWDDLFRELGPTLVGECDDEQFYEKLRMCFFRSLPADERSAVRLDSFIVPNSVVDQVKVQFQALGLIDIGDKPRSLTDKSTYWKLTAYGRKYLLRLRAWTVERGSTFPEMPATEPGKAAAAGSEKLD